jgi:tail collar domain
MNRRGFLKSLAVAPLVPAVLMQMDWPEAEAAPAVEPGLLSAEEARRLDPIVTEVPPGTILPFVGECPDGWLPCDGRYVGVKEYPALWEAIKNTYGADVTSYRFKLPDMRGSHTTKCYNSSHDHSMTPESMPSSHAHTMGSNNANHTHHVLWFHPATYMIKT